MNLFFLDSSFNITIILIGLALFLLLGLYNFIWKQTSESLENEEIKKEYLEKRFRDELGNLKEDEVDDRLSVKRPYSKKGKWYVWKIADKKWEEWGVKGFINRYTLRPRDRHYKLFTIYDYELDEVIKTESAQMKEDDYQLKEDDYQLKEDDYITDIIQDRATRQAFGLISGKLDARFEVGVLKLQEEVEVWLRKIRLEKTLKEKEIDNLLMKTKDLYDPFIKVQYVLSKILFDKGDKEKKANILKIHQCKTLIRDFIKKGDEDFQEFVKKIQEDLQKYEEKLQKTQSTRGIELPIFLIREIWMNELHTQSLKSN